MSMLAVPVHPDESGQRTQQELQASADPQLTWNLLSKKDLIWKAPLGYFCAVLGQSSQPQAWSSSLGQPRVMQPQASSSHCKSHPRPWETYMMPLYHFPASFCGPDPWALTESAPFPVLLPL